MGLFNLHAYHGCYYHVAFYTKPAVRVQDILKDIEYVLSSPIKAAPNLNQYYHEENACWVAISEITGLDLTHNQLKKMLLGNP